MATTVIEKILRRDRALVATGLVIICLLAWWYLFNGAGTGMNTLAMSTSQLPLPVHASQAAQNWSYHYWIIMALMWWVMMIAMMTPSAAPMILLYARVYRQAQNQGQIDSPIIPTTSFAAGYLIVWLGFSLVVTLLQWWLEQVGLIHSIMMWSTHTVLSGSLLVAAGIYQISSLKTACLQQCRSPVQFISQNWRYGAARMGVIHGIHCLGCCWLLMALLFVGGVMNLVWIAGLAIFVLLEKLLPSSSEFNRISSIILIATGIWLLIQ